MTVMQPNGFDFAWNGTRIKIRTDASYAEGFLTCENIVVRNFKGVVSRYWPAYGDEPKDKPNLL